MGSGSGTLLKAAKDLGLSHEESRHYSKRVVSMLKEGYDEEKISEIIRDQISSKSGRIVLGKDAKDSDNLLCGSALTSMAGASSRDLDGCDADNLPSGHKNQADSNVRRRRVQSLTSACSGVPKVTPAFTCSLCSVSFPDGIKLQHHMNFSKTHAAKALQEVESGFQGEELSQADLVKIQNTVTQTMVRLMAYYDVNPRGLPVVGPHCHVLHRCNRVMNTSPIVQETVDITVYLLDDERTVLSVPVRGPVVEVIVKEIAASSVHIASTGLSSSSPDQSNRVLSKCYFNYPAVLDMVQPDIKKELGRMRAAVVKRSLSLNYCVPDDVAKKLTHDILGSTLAKKVEFDFSKSDHKGTSPLHLQHKMENAGRRLSSVLDKMMTSNAPVAAAAECGSPGGPHAADTSTSSEVSSSSSPSKTTNALTVAVPGPLSSFSSPNTTSSSSYHMSPSTHQTAGRPVDYLTGGSDWEAMASMDMDSFLASLPITTVETHAKAVGGGGGGASFDPMDLPVSHSITTAAKRRGRAASHHISLPGQSSNLL